jgi:hypothetical protein
MVIDYYLLGKLPAGAAQEDAAMPSRTTTKND